MTEVEVEAMTEVEVGAHQETSGRSDDLELALATIFGSKELTRAGSLFTTLTFQSIQCNSYRKQGESKPSVKPQKSTNDGKFKHERRFHKLLQSF